MGMWMGMMGMMRILGMMGMLGMMEINRQNDLGIIRRGE
jgi:hypothetical protein